jgi:hypothetical protein
MTATEAKWERFLLALIDCNWGDVPSAYMSVYGTRDRASASKAANILSKNEKFQTFAKERIESMLGDKKAVLGPKVIDTWITRAFYKVSDILDEKGKLKCSLEELDKKGLIAAIDSIEQRKSKYGSYVVIRLADRDQALEKLASFIKLTDSVPGTKVEVSVNENRPRIMTIERLTEDQWREFYKQITSGGPNQDKSMP